MTPPLSESEVLALADRALALAGPRAQVTAIWERRATTVGGPQVHDHVQIEFVCLDGAGIGRATTSDVDEAGLGHAAGAARELAAQGAEPAGAELPEAAPGRTHQGWDPGVLSVDPAAVAAELDQRFEGAEAAWHCGAARTAIVSTAGVRAFEQRSFASLRVSRSADGRTVTESIAAGGPKGLDLDAVVARMAAQSSSEPPVEALAGEHPVVLGPAAVAVVLDLVRPHFGALAATGTSAVADRLGRRVVASCVALSESPRFPGTLPRSYDAEGLPRQPLPLVQDGVAHRVVRDSASPGGPSTGHATVALASAPVPEHLVLVGGGAGDEDDLAAPLERGLHISALDPSGRRGLGAFVIEHGRRTAPLRDVAVDIDALAVLAATQALTMSQRLIDTGDVSARTVGATMCPALRAGAGVRVRS